MQKRGRKARARSAARQRWSARIGLGLLFTGLSSGWHVNEMSGPPLQAGLSHPVSNPAFIAAPVTAMAVPSPVEVVDRWMTTEWAATSAPLPTFAAREPAGLPPGLAIAAVAPTFDDSKPRPLTTVLEVEKGDTLIDLLLQSGVSRTDAVEAVEALKGVFSPRDLKPGHEITLDFVPVEGFHRVSYEPQFNGLSLRPSIEQDVVVTRDESGEFVATAIAHPLRMELAFATATIDSSLFAAGQEAAVPLKALSQVVKAFSYDVDFEREIQPGDRFEIVYERFEDEDGNLARTGRVLYAAITVERELKEIYLYETLDGVEDFYSGTGESVRKALLRTPLDVVRITSNFGMRRHPVLGYSRMHKGVDFAAGTGTPIFAAGDGTIVKQTKMRGYGNYVQIKHNAQYSTAYAHLSRFAKGLKAGSKVRQGDVIGYVGMTGTATGPHLHYEILVGGKQINPLSVKLVGKKLEGKDLQRFEALKAEIQALRDRLAQPLVYAHLQAR